MGSKVTPKSSVVYIAAADIGDVWDDDADASERNADGLEIVTVNEPIPGVPGATWRRENVLWATKTAAPWVHHEPSIEPVPADEARPDLVKLATAMLGAETPTAGRRPDANVVRTESGRKSRSRRAAVSNAAALAIIRHHHGDTLDVLHAASAITATQHAIGQALHRDICEAERHAMLLTQPPRAEEGDMRTFVAGDSEQVGGDLGGDDQNGEPLSCENDIGSTGMPEIREPDTSPARRRLDAAFLAIQTRLQGDATGWALVSGPQAPGPRWHVLTGTDGRSIIRRLPHAAHVWPNLGKSMLPLTPTWQWVPRVPAPWEGTRQVWRWLCGAVTSTSGGAHLAPRREVAWLRDWLDTLAHVYAPIVTGQSRRETAVVAYEECLGMKCEAKCVSHHSSRPPAPDRSPLPSQATPPVRRVFLTASRPTTVIRQHMRGYNE